MGLRPSCEYMGWDTDRLPCRERGLGAPTAGAGSQSDPGCRKGDETLVPQAIGAGTQILHECRCWDTTGASAGGQRTGDMAVTAAGEAGQHSAPTPSIGAGCSELYPSGRRGAGTPSSGVWGCTPSIGVQPWMGGMLQGPPAGRGSRLQTVPAALHQALDDVGVYSIKVA